ncbi:hypothetical protein SAMN04489724_4078 [Algoriphagus locisalis]|uniref:Lipocalin-like domain-containing protein n=1 Tax=Algoriphagus locisalis TaxID=305507 RepID=A0A1I7DKG3_9BACT|nr:hypothetical protein [Algoriphagus locisalis]SFU12150.1 hypothetical protein SAMN04489724_4078 [Algoriphagus locisalis]
MNFKLLPLVIIVFVLISCKEDEEVNPEVLTQYHWEKAFQDLNFDPPYEVVYSIDFQIDGKVHYESYFRDLETKDILGFIEYYDGNYQVGQNKITVLITEHYTNQVSGEMYSDKDQLTLMEIVNQSREFQLRNNNSELHTIMPLYSSSLGIIYERVL